MVAIVGRAELLDRLPTRAESRPADDHVPPSVPTGELTGTQAGQILGIHASTISRRCDRLLSAARRALMENAS